MRRAAGRWPRLGLVGLGMLGALVVVAAAAPWLAPYDPNAQVARPFAPPSSAHPLGANDIGQDLLSELLFGARVSLAVGIAAALVATVIGTVVGLVAGYVGGWVDAVLMRAADVALALPFLPLMIVVAVFLGPGLGTMILVIATVIWAEAARRLRAQVLSAREREPVRAAQAMGASRWYVLARHLLPVLFPLVIPQFVRAASFAVLAEASLSFLGLGDATAKSWGTTLSYANARSAFLTDAWLWWILPPGLCITVAVLSFVFIGHALEERARPRLRALAPAWRRPPPPGDAAPGDETLLRIEGLTVIYGGVRAVDGVRLDVHRGELLGLVGSSGSGKSTLVAAVMRLLKAPARVEAGRVLLDGEDLLDASPARLRALRGGPVALVPQAAMNALNPILPAWRQIAEAIRLHGPVRRATAKERALTLLEAVGIPRGRARSYPHEFSGGMRQRAVIAMALANDPRLLLADEPTTGLDPRIQQEILQLLHDLRARLDLGIVLISHDLALVSRVADAIVVLRAGKIVEQGPVSTLLAAPQHSYTRRLLRAALPQRTRPPSRGGGRPLLQLRGIHKRYGRVVAVAGVDLEVREGEVVGLVGESGAGKSTLARLVLCLESPDAGRVQFEGRELCLLDRRTLRTARRRLHLVFQDPYQSLPEHLRVGAIVAEPLRIHGEDGVDRRVPEALRAVGLDPGRYASRYPSELSGGERQRVALARAAVLRPRLIVLDEPTSMLDAELRQGLLASLEELKDRFGVSYLCITHDLPLAQAFCDRLIVLREGRVVETGPVDALTVHSPRGLP